MVQENNTTQFTSKFQFFSELALKNTATEWYFWDNKEKILSFHKS